VQGKLCIYVVGGVEEEPIMYRKNDVLLVAMAKQRLLGNILGRLKHSIEKGCDKQNFLIG